MLSNLVIMTVKSFLFSEYLWYSELVILGGDPSKTGVTHREKIFQYTNPMTSLQDNPSTLDASSCLNDVSWLTSPRANIGTLQFHEQHECQPLVPYSLHSLQISSGVQDRRRSHRSPCFLFLPVNLVRWYVAHDPKLELGVTCCKLHRKQVSVARSLLPL
jgi:hypothetical protein